MFLLVLYFPMKDLLPWRICSHSAPRYFCEPQQSCFAPLSLKGCHHHSNTCIITHNACPNCQSKCGELTFWYVHVCIPASPLNPAGTSEHSYWVIHKKLWVRIRWAKEEGVWGKKQLHWGLNLWYVCFRFQETTRNAWVKTMLFPFPKISLIWGSVFAINGSKEGMHMHYHI